MEQKLFSLNRGWTIRSGNDAPDALWHECGIPEDGAACADLPCFAHMALEDHVGISWYQKRFHVPALPGAHERAVLTFESADFRCVPSLNGKILGEHTGCEDPFSFDVTDLLLPGENRLTVRISKPYEKPVDGYTFGEVPHRNEHPVGLMPGACYNESGLSGGVSLAYLPDCRVDDLFPECDASSGLIRLHVTVHSDRAEKVPANLRLSVRRDPDGEAEDAALIETTLHPGDNDLCGELTVPDFRLWSTEEPNLYAVTAELMVGEIRHSRRVRTGFRTFCVGEDGYFRLNGKRILLRGSHTGNCMPLSTHHISGDPELLRKDFLLAKAVGFNCIRFISGAALPLQLDLCDEIGLMVYVEPVSGWLTENGPHAADNFRHDLFSMVKRDRCHPSLTIWGLLNETFDRPPYDDVCKAARTALPELRRLDPTRLVLFSSGRWDARDDTGSVSNPYTSDWQKLWNGEGMDQPEHPEDFEAFPPVYPIPSGVTGDLHYYPSPVPMKEKEIRTYRSYGRGYRRPVFLSESGIGSVLDTISLVRRWEQQGITGFYPDVKMVRRMNDSLSDLLRRYGLEEAVPFPSELMRGSMNNHVWYRSQTFDLMRSNPYLCGISLTGLLDHSICGEGLWTLFREFKPGIADVLQNGFAPLRWCLIPNRTDLFAGDRLHMEAVLANEDVLQVGRTYTVCAGILGKNGARDLRTYSFTVTEEDARVLAIPVFEEDWETAKLEPGEYTFHAELLSGADAAGGNCVFRISERPKARLTAPVCVTGFSEKELGILAELGIRTLPLDRWNGEPVLCGRINAENRAQIAGLLESGAVITALRASERDDEALLLLLEERRPFVDRAGDWLYHRETVLRPGCPVFGELETGMIPAAHAAGFVPSCTFDAPQGQEPEETWAFAFCTGYPVPSGFLGGYLLGLNRVGRGRLILNAFELTDNLTAAPDSALLLCRLLEYAEKLTKSE